MYTILYLDDTFFFLKKLFFLSFTFKPISSLSPIYTFVFSYQLCFLNNILNWFPLVHKKITMILIVFVNFKNYNEY